ncbi:MAG: bifunctional DNA primase/polymerase, partial [Nitrososphaerota archaeon]
MSGEIPGGTPPPTSFRDINCGVLLYNLLTADLIETSRRLHGFGYNVVPTRAKRPLVNSWKKWQDSRQSIGELESLSWDCADSIAVITGAPEKRLFCVDVDGDETPLEVKEIWIKGLAEIFGLRSQKTPRGFHYFGLLDGEMNSTNISGLPGHLHVIPADKLNRAIEILRRLWRLNLPLDLLCELRTRGERSEADMKLFIKLLREGWNDDDIYMAWTLLSDRFITEVRERKHRDPHDYFNLTLEKAKKWLEEHSSGVSEGG